MYYGSPAAAGRRATFLGFLTTKIDGKTREQLEGINFQFHEWIRELQELYEDRMPGRQNWQAENKYPVFLALDERQCPIDDPQGYRDNGKNRL